MTMRLVSSYGRRGGRFEARLREMLLELPSGGTAAVFCATRDHAKDVARRVQRAFVDLAGAGLLQLGGDTLVISPPDERACVRVERRS